MLNLSLIGNWELRSEELAVDKEQLALVLCRSEGWLQTNIHCDIHQPLIRDGIIKEPLENEQCNDCR